MLQKREVFEDFFTLEEPVGVFVPDGAIKLFDGFGEAVGFEVFGDGFGEAVELAADPIFGHRESVVGWPAGSLAVGGTFRDTEFSRPVVTGEAPLIPRS